MTRLNALQTRTLALLQEMARDADIGRRQDAAGEVEIALAVHGHRDHVHIGRFTVSSRFASGLANPNVLAALERKGLIRNETPERAILTAAGLAFDTGIADRMLDEADH